jgi:hypothetical protein
MKRPVRPQIRQHSCQERAAGGSFTDSVHPQSNDAGEVIEREL